VGGISGSIIESINKIGSLINGPILATFLLAILTRRARDAGVVLGILAGFLTNLYLWRWQPGVSWLWWNVIGCAVTFSVGYTCSLILPGETDRPIEKLVFRRDARTFFGYRRHWGRYYIVLVVYFLAMLAAMLVAQHVVSG
jgi:SSS family solute:Na+ symporter